MDIEISSATGEILRIVERDDRYAVQARRERGEVWITVGLFASSGEASREARRMAKSGDRALAAPVVEVF